MAGMIKLADGKTIEGERVSVLESTERWSDFTLSDGTVLRAKVTLVGAIRVEGEFDQLGNPAYAVEAGVITHIGSAPDNLKKKL